MTFEWGQNFSTLSMGLQKDNATAVTTGTPPAGVLLPDNTWTPVELRLACSPVDCKPTVLVGGQAITGIMSMPVMNPVMNPMTFRVFAGMLSFMPNDEADVLIDDLVLTAD